MLLVAFDLGASSDPAPKWRLTGPPPSPPTQPSLHTHHAASTVARSGTKYAPPRVKPRRDEWARLARTN